MDESLVEIELRRKICEALSVIPEGEDRFIIASPFTFDDGDSITIILKKIEDIWYFTDEGHTFMHLSYDDIDFEKGTRREIIDLVLRTHYIKDDNGELKIKVADESYGEAFFTFLQGLTKISAISILKTDRIKSLFMEEFESFLRQLVGNEAIFNYTDPSRDRVGLYKVDCFIPMHKPILIFGIPTSDKCRDSTITLLNFQKWGIPFTSIAVFEDQEKITKSVLHKFRDVSGRNYSSLDSAKKYMPEYIKELFEAYA
jgi:hypothetical protein